MAGQAERLVLGGAIQGSECTLKPKIIIIIIIFINCNWVVTRW
jgi:hypothetical protein